MSVSTHASPITQIPLGDAGSTTTRDALGAYLDGLLQPATYRDWSPNGLQVEGRDAVRTVVVGVTANLRLLEEAVRLGADAVVVHHGWFWDKEPRTLVGPRLARVRAVLGANLSLFAYHLPLDGHASVGNCAGILQRVGAEPVVGFAGQPPVGWIGRLPAAQPAARVAELLAAALQLDPALPSRAPLYFAGGDHAVQTIAVVTGGGAGYAAEAQALGADFFVTGEASEGSAATAYETGLPILAAGHHHTERIGPWLLGQRIAADLGVQVVFVDVANEV